MLRGMVLVFLLLLSGLIVPLHAAPRLVRIGLVLDGPLDDRPELRRLGEEELGALLQGQFEARMPEDKALLADGTPAGVAAALYRLLADPEVDLVVAGGIIASHLAAQQPHLPKPVIAPLIIDPRLQGLPARGPFSGVPNLSYLIFPANLRQDLVTCREVVPFTRVALLFDRPTSEAIPGLATYYLEEARRAGVEASLVPTGRDADEVLAALPKEVEAVFLALPLKLPPAEFARLAEGLRARGLPSFSATGTQQVEAGLLAGLHQEADTARLVRRLALNIRRLLSGEAAETLPVVFARSERLVINMATARAIGIYPSWQVLTEAQLLHPARDQVLRVLSLEEAVDEAIRVNQDLAASQRALTAGAQRVRAARSRLLPQAEVSADGTLIDQERASPVQTERSLTGTATLVQLVYGERIWADLEVQRQLQRARQAEHQQRRLDLVQETASAYLGVLRAKTFERVQQENLELTRSNLEMARVRQVVGTAGPAEVHRWESQIATDRQRLIEANASRNQAEMALNRLLHRPSEEPFALRETGLDDQDLITHEPRFRRYIGNPYNFRIFRAFMVQEGLGGAPELVRLDAGIAAQERIQQAAQRAFWSPTATLQGGLARTLARGGAGAAVDNPSGDAHWSAGLELRLPLYTGGGRRAARAEAGEELERLRLERQALADRVEQRIRAALHRAGASYAGIGLREEAAQAARQGLDLVEQGYSQGAVSMLDLLDAQNAALVAGEGAANAVYNFLIELMEVERALGRYYFYASQEERDQWFARLEAFAAAQRAQQ